MNKIFLTFSLFIISFTPSLSQSDVIFSHEAGFYNEPFYLKLNVEKGELFYFDENNIDKDRKSFPDSLLIDKTNTLSLLVSHADSVHKLGSFSYFIGFNTSFKVVSISIDNDFLFDTYKGIYVKGPRAYFDTVSNHYRNVNWEKKWERENFVEIFNEKGERIVSQNSGIKIFGGMTKYYSEKSLRLIARTEYGVNRFDADIFNKGKKKYKQFILRHSGNDWDKLRFKDAFTTSLASESGLDVQASSPCHLFVNSEYWGVYNIREKINVYYIDNNHNSGTSGVDILQGYRTVEAGSQHDYNALLSYIRKNDLSIDKNYFKVQEMMDTRNFANFQIHQLYYANHDAMGNIRFWKSDSLDGKFRWIVYDTDLGFGPNRFRENSLKDFTSSVQTDWYNRKWATFLLRNLLENERFKQDFIMQSSFILNTILSKDHVIKRINEFKELYEEEMHIHFSNQRRRFKSYRGNLKKWQQSIDGVTLFAKKRDMYSFVHLEQKFNLQEPYLLKLIISNKDAGLVLLNGNEITVEDFKGRFYSEYDLPISIIPNLGYSANGYTDSVINADKGDTISITIKFTKNHSSEEQIIINEIDYVNDCFEIYNQGSSTINLSGWKLKDKNNNIFSIENCVLQKGRFAVFHYNNIEQKIDTVQYCTIDFRVSSSDEFLEIYDKEERLVDRVDYQLSETKISYRRNIPFNSFNDIEVSWKNDSSISMGYHNPFYTNMLEEIYQQELQEKKSLRVVMFSFGAATLIPLLFFLIKRRRKNKSTLQS
ncbi:MAG: hypothetical protein HOA52_05685 [Flavobacteriales bacterium]|nr:hypothetical protein [Flavobacteriales bacterium]